MGDEQCSVPFELELTRGSMGTGWLKGQYTIHWAEKGHIVASVAKEQRHGCSCTVS
eukprot:NODE_7851_length_382_cov_147.042042_g6147_i0.p1 GENE.NODE_7851_length_382_cov_147.042042_g6147_i0~~NODE_7851_length_382_cov_147.042042_g6147_i0.p1  ORF type:complete len:63 (+),score=29.56 NODE_7851_length_382_cov_147.042042_g6147_i0:22-189(+)